MEKYLVILLNAQMIVHHELAGLVAIFIVCPVALTVLSVSYFTFREISPKKIVIIGGIVGTTLSLISFVPSDNLSWGIAVAPFIVSIFTAFMLIVIQQNFFKRKKVKIAVPINYDEAEAIMLKEMRRLAEEDTSIEIHMGSVSYTPAQIVEEIINRTDVGVKYINSYIAGCKFFNS